FVTAPHNQSSCGDHAVGTLPPFPARILLDAIDRHFRGASEDREHRPILEEVDGVVAPFAGGDLTAIKAKNAIELLALESDVMGGGEGCGAGGRFAPAELAGVGLAGTEGHAAPPYVRYVTTCMIAPDGRNGKALATTGTLVDEGTAHAFVK